ncbi:MAG TPA: hypothetical protein VID27_15645, partial [Blastocatellia bacterium]
NQVAGDYLYTVFLPGQSQLGAWGIFRVLDANGKPVVGKPSCAPVPAEAGKAPPTPQLKSLDRFIRQPANKDDKPQQ